MVFDGFALDKQVKSRECRVAESIEYVFRNRCAYSGVQLAATQEVLFTRFACSESCLGPHLGILSLPPTRR